MVDKMSWLSDLLKYLTPAKPLVIGLFIAALVGIVGPRLWPELFSFKIPSEWDWLVWMVAIVTFFIITSWSVNPLVRSTSKLISWLVWHPKIRPLSNQEEKVLVILGLVNPTEYLLLSRITNESIPLLALIQTCRKLEKRRLVTFHSKMLEDRVKLTERGESITLSLCKRPDDQTNT